MGRTVVVGIRLPEEVKREIEERGYKVPVFIKAAVEAELKRRRSEEALDWIKANRVQGKQVGFDSVRVIRRLRETK